MFKDYYIDNVFDLVLGKEAPEEEPFEDYAKCRTFDSNVISVGGELVYGCSNSKCVVLKIGVETFVVITDDGSICSEPKNKMWKRTGRNFPAIEQIINLIKKEKEDA